MNGKGLNASIENKINNAGKEQEIWQVLQTVNDPEVPVLSVVDLGIIRSVSFANEEGSEDQVIISITPTYSGCPAMDAIRINIRMALAEKGFRNTKLETVLSPAWTTDWMSEEGKKKLKAFGIAPPTPVPSVCHLEAFAEDEAIQCPRCNSFNTRQISRFGSTACKAIYQCNDCLEPFDYFKCH